MQGCIASVGNVEDAIEDMLLTEKLNCFLEGLPIEKRKIFMRRYWYLSGAGGYCLMREAERIIRAYEKTAMIGDMTVISMTPEDELILYIEKLGTNAVAR